MSETVQMAFDQAVISINPNIQSGEACFQGTRVPIKNLFDHLEDGYSIFEFLDAFPSVTPIQVEKVLELSHATLIKAHENTLG